MKYTVKDHIAENKDQYSVLAIFLALAYAPTFLSIGGLFGLGLSFLFLCMSVIVLYSINKSIFKAKNTTFDFIMFAIFFELAFSSILIYILMAHKEAVKLPIALLLGAFLGFFVNKWYEKWIEQSIRSKVLNGIIRFILYISIIVLLLFMIDLFTVLVIPLIL